MIKNIDVLIIQNNAVLGNISKNIENVGSLLKQYDGEKFDLILLPEVWSVGWACYLFEKSAQTEFESQSLVFVEELAKKFNANVIGGSYIRKLPDGKLRNTMPIINRDGKLIANYDKMHLFSNCGCNESSYIENGKSPVVVDLDFGRVGVSICYDIRFPEIYRAYGKAGVDVLVNCASWPLSRPHHWDTLARARAIENQAFMIAVSQAGVIDNDEYNLGHSQIISPFGEVVAKMGNGIGTLKTTIDISETKKLREKFPVLKDIHNIDDYKILEVK